METLLRGGGRCYFWQVFLFFLLLSVSVAVCHLVLRNVQAFCTACCCSSRLLFHWLMHWKNIENIWLVFIAIQYFVALLPKYAHLYRWVYAYSGMLLRFFYYYYKHQFIFVHCNTVAAACSLIFFLLFLCALSQLLLIYDSNSHCFFQRTYIINACLFF